MYKISVPIMNACLKNYDKNIYISKLKEMEVERVFLCPSGNNGFWNNYEEELQLLKENTEFLHINGFEVGIWVWAFVYEKESNFTYMTSPTGKVSKLCVCPADENYREIMGQFVKDAAKCGIDLFQFDDDYRFGFQDMGFGCCCKNHLKLISDSLNENVSIETIDKNLLYGKSNKYRTAFLQANGKSLEDFAEYIRKCLDEVNPEIRMGFCSCISSWDIDGTTPDRIAKKLAGKTKPFYRLIGAPYWANERNWGNRLADVIEFERLEATRRIDNEIEMFSEGDTYPRPRYKVPASYLEIFDTALRVADCTDGILKYVFDYNASPDYEPGYVNAHIRNKKLYADINKIFSDKQSVGIRIWDKSDKYKDAIIPDKVAGTDAIQDFAFSPAIRLLNACSFPAEYNKTGSNIGIAFGEDIKAVPEHNLSDGLIVDLRACEILKEKGIDTGIITVGEKFTPGEEYYTDFNEHIGLYGAEYKAVTIDKKATIESYVELNGKKYPASFRYENENGQRFLVYCFDAYFNNETVFRQYTRAKQIKNAAEWLSCKKLPVICENNPDLYIQAKKNSESTAVALWNISPDSIENPVVELDFIPKTVKTINCKAKLSGNKVLLSELTAYGFCAFEVK